MKPIKVGIVMDPVAGIRPQKDSTFALMLEAAARGWELHYMEMGDLWLEGDTAWGRMRRISVFDRAAGWYEFREEMQERLSSLDLILMRKDPPFDMEYVMATYILERAEAAGVLVANSPRALRDINEKVFTAWFPSCCPPGLLTRSMAGLLEFLDRHGKIVIKPTCKMGGQSVYILAKGDPNTHVMIEDATLLGTRFVQAQGYVPDIVSGGDKRVLLVDGEPVPYGLARIPGKDDHRGNLVAGAEGKGFELTDRERRICSLVGPVLRERGVVFAGLDIIGEYLTEINITSPTCIREIERLYPVRIARALLDILEKQIETRTLC